ncbi:penicillin-binding protein 1C [Thiolinea disciformis]|uniref:penicillin-binding protein 1C n=1 Tax=Thiolinea disciformis TaxID=125614 RepID=UPI00036A594F|nr:penicillin-binding protein 1C [Thiolinea disciformis]
MRLNTKRFRLKRWLISLSLVLFIALVWWWQTTLPTTLFAAPFSNIVLDRDGNLLSAQIAKDGQWRFPELASVPDKFAKSLVLFEDKRFYQHQGVDGLALARAFWLNTKHWRVVSGGSTISMQVVRLSRKNPPRTLIEKLNELLRAIKLEVRYDKSSILKLYASHAPFGGNVVGLEAAAWRYFGRNPEQLSWAESALLAVLPNNPALVHLGRNRAKLQQKRDLLLKKLLEANALTELDYKLAVLEPLPEAPRPLPRLAPHLLDTLAQRQAQGQRFHTTLNGSLQQQVLALAQRSGDQLAMEGVHNLAIVVLDNRHFETLAYVGNRPGLEEDNQGHAIDLIQRPRSTGSTLKPFLFAAMLEQGELLPSSLIPDVPVSYSGFTPQNYNRTYHGAVSAQEALARSLNIPMVNMLSLHGVEPFQGFLQQMGMQHLKRPARDYGLSLILGGAEGTLWELTQMYANLAYRAGQTSQGQVNFWQQARLLQTDVSTSNRPATISTAGAWLTLQALMGVARPGDEGYWEKFSSSQTVAWKTGTSYGHRDAWAIGITPHYTIGVWVGNASGEGRTGLTGTQSAAPILFNTFNLLPSENAWFTRPDWQMTQVEVCHEDGYLSNGACDTKRVDVPLSAHFARITPYHHRIQLDASGQWRVDSNCESVQNMQLRSWFVLPPDQAQYYQQHHANYQPLPPWRADCQNETIALDEAAISLVYPRPNTQIYLPRELDGKRNQTVFRAVPRHPETLLYWHLDQVYLGSTQTFHQQAVSVPSGKHQLTVVDEMGNRVEQHFEVLYEPETTATP